MEKTNYMMAVDYVARKLDRDRKCIALSDSIMKNWRLPDIIVQVKVPRTYRSERFCFEKRNIVYRRD